MLTSCTAVVHGNAVSYRRAGEGTAVVLLHGIGSNSLTWEPVASALAERHDVIAPDFLGHGASAKPRGDYSLGAFASGVRDLLQLLGVERATLVGHSLGGGVAMQFAYQHPELCERLVLVSSGGLGHSVSPLLRAAALPGSEWVLPVIAGAAGGVGAKVGDVLARVGLRAGHDMAEVGRGMADLGDREARLAFLDTLRAVVGPGGQRVSALDRLYLAADLPLLIVWGERDPIIPVGHGRRAHAAVPGSEMLEVADAGHFPQLDDPTGFVTAVTRFVASSEPWAYDPARVRELMLAGRAVCRVSRMAREPIYTAYAHVTGGRADGHGKTDDGVLEVNLRRPKEMGGEGDGTNPEQLFAVGYAACFEGALGAVAAPREARGRRRRDRLERQPHPHRRAHLRARRRARRDAALGAG